MRLFALLLALLAALPAAADGVAEDAAHAAVRAALLEGATLPPRPEGDLPATRAAHEAARDRRRAAEEAAHSRAASHGARRSRDAGSEHGDRQDMHGGSTMSGSGMGSGWDCGDPAENHRMMDEHDGVMPHQPRMP